MGTIKNYTIAFNFLRLHSLLDRVPLFPLCLRAEQLRPEAFSKIFLIHCDAAPVAVLLAVTDLVPTDIIIDVVRLFCTLPGIISFCTGLVLFSELFITLFLRDRATFRSIFQAEFFLELAFVLDLQVAILADKQPVLVGHRSSLTIHMGLDILV